MKRRRLGQHYLVDEEVVRRIVEMARIRPSEKVLEIGTGKGALTKELAGRGASLDGYEVDEANYEETKKSVEGTNARIHFGDVFDAEPDFDVLVSSLPYSESATFLEWLSGVRFDRAVVVLQEDFVHKIMAPPGSRDYRGISAVAQIACDIRELGRVDRRAFSPVPRVNSVIASFEPRRRLTAIEISNILRLFSLRRRQVGSALAELGLLAKQDYGRKRVYGLEPDEVLQICRLSAE